MSFYFNLLKISQDYKNLSEYYKNLGGDIPEEENISILQGLPDKTVDKSTIIRNICEMYGITPIPSGSGSSRLGSGMYGTVFEAIYNGQRVAVKVAAPDEMAPYLEIKNRREQLPENLQSVLPIVYEIIDHYDDPDINLSVIIMEKLYPLDKQTQLLYFFKYNKEEKDIDLSHTQQLMRTSLNAVVKNLDELIEEYLADVSSIYGNPKKAVYNKRKLPKALRILKKALLDLDEKMESKHIQMFIKDITDLFAKGIGIPDYDGELYDMIITALPVEQLMPWTPNEFAIQNLTPDKDYQTSGFSDPKVQTFLNKVRALQRHGIAYTDMHWENVLQRQNGELVFADVGLFAFG